MTDKKIPTEPGWYWYEDKFYTGPVLVDWSGFVHRPNLRALVVYECTEEEQELVGCIVSELGGTWTTIEESPMMGFTLGDDGQ